MANDSEVLIKIAADIAGAVANLNTLVTQMAAVNKTILEANRVATEAAPKTKNFWDSWTTGAVAGGAAAVATGNIISNVLTKAFDSAVSAANTLITAIPSMVDETANAGDAFLVMSQKTGVSVESLSQLDFVASQTNTELGAISRSIGLFGENLIKGGDKFKAVSKSMGLDVAALKAMKPEDAFTEVMSVLGKIPDAATRATAGGLLFGKTFKQIANLTQEDIRGLMTEADGLGLTMTESAAKMGDAYTDALDRMSRVWEGFRRQVGTALLPSAIELVEGISKRIQQFLKDLGINFDSVGETALSAVRKIIDIFDVLMDAVTPVAQAIIKFLQTAFTRLPEFIAIFSEAIKAAIPFIEGFTRELAKIDPETLKMIGKLGLAGVAVDVVGGKMVDAGAAAATMTSGFKDTLELSGKLAKTLNEATWFQKITDSMKGLMGHLGSLAKWVGSMVPGFTGLGQILGVVAGAVKGVAAVGAGTVGIFVALGAAVAAVVAFFLKFTKAGTASAGILGSIWSVVKDVAAIVGTSFLIAWEGVVYIFGKVVQFAKFLYDGLASLVTIAGQNVQKYQDYIPILGQLSKAFEVAGNVAKWVASQVKALRDNIEGFLAYIRGIEMPDVKPPKIFTDRDTSALAQFNAELLDIKETAPEIPGFLDGLRGALDKLGKSADTNKTTLQKWQETVKELNSSLTAANTANASAAQIMEAFGKKASEALAEAALIPGALAKIPPEVRRLGESFDRLELAKKVTELNAKVTELNAKLAELVKSFGTEMVSAVRTSQDAVMQMLNEMTLNMLSGSEQRLMRIKFEEDAQIQSIERQQEQLENSLAAQIKAIEEHTAERIKAEQEALAAGKKVSQERLAAIKQEEGAAIASAVKQASQTRQQYAEQLAIIRRYYIQKRELETASTRDFETDAKLLGLQTKKAAEEQLQIERDKLAFMKENSKQFTAAAIAAQEAIVKAAEEAATGVTSTWQKATDAIGDMFARMATIGGDSFSGLSQAMGRGANAGAELRKSMEGMAEAFKGKDWKSFAASAAAGAGAAVEAGQALGQATDSLNRGKNIAKGAATGAQIGGAIVPGWGHVVGAAVGAIVGAFRKRDAQRAFAEVGRETGIKISEATAKAIQDTSNEMYGGHSMGRWLGRIHHLADIVKDAGGITAKNFKGVTKQFMDGLDFLDQGKIKSEDFKKMADQVFPQLADHAMKTGGVWSKSFAQMVQGIKTAGLEVQGFKELIDSQLMQVSTGLGKMVGAFQAKEIDRASELIAEKKALEADALKAGPQGLSDEQAARLKEVTTELGALRQAAVGSQVEFDRLGRLSLAAFNAMKKEGKSTTESIQAISPQIQYLKLGMESLGLQGNEAFDQLSRLSDLTMNNAALLESAAGVNEMMTALSNLGSLTAETFADLQAQGVAAFEQMKLAGFTEQEALAQIAPMLETSRDLVLKKGMAIDDTTAKLIKQAEEQGILKDVEVDSNELMLDGLAAIIKALGGDVPESFKKFGKAAEEEAKRAEDAIKKAEEAAKQNSKELEKTPWAGFAAKGAKAAFEVKTGLVEVVGSAGRVAKQLEETDWDAWARAAVDAATEVSEAVDGVSLGHSPGGLKEIPLKIAEALRSFREFQRTGVGAARQVEDAVNAVYAGQAGVMSTGFSAMEMKVAQAVDSRDSQSESMRQLEDAIKGIKGGDTFIHQGDVNASAIDTTGLRELVEAPDGLAALTLQAMRANRRGMLTALRELIGDE